MSKEYIIAEEELRDLLENRAELWALECAGVDNLEWYDEARSNIEETPEDLSTLYMEVEE
ncbi:hypothetical protein [Eubacterium limosum]|uniref:Uncharacterized protein n=1 Tax=Eubacterium limosum TaxID=1736 RepID=A0AAC9QUY9_EUBLI|nr:hypothetical protein [Eubacterium limosum]ARD64045.1 hypothetical protein B2M23_00080 [Eubacterium limosum]ARD66083.1 hypothetical protein B2M23_11260 [Eubacterium limosum]PWW59868.1 hypothetical protein C7955_101267 [Eubacterium limosum]UQZ21986.1 hypothetical protein M5595_17405 [Eubacterium limosum]UQZ22623.1 hypothetical protein M5595_20850 [Eubacterium limosum]